jgi:hypothetical protein
MGRMLRSVRRALRFVLADDLTGHEPVLLSGSLPTSDARPGTKKKDPENLNQNLNILKIELLNYILGSRF